MISNCTVFGREGSDAIGINEGRIAFIGIDRDLRAKKRIDLSGKIVFPGFIDSHAHLLSTGLEDIRLNLYHTKSKEEVVERIAEYSKGKEKVIAYRWDESMWKPQSSYLTSSDINGIPVPVVAFRRDGHMAVANQKAMDVIGTTRKEGIFKEDDIELLEPLVKPNEAEIRDALNTAANRAISLGIVAVRDMVDISTYNEYKNIKTPLKIYKVLYSDSIFDKFGTSSQNDWGIKAFLDGSLGSRTAAHKGWDASNLKMDESKFENFAKQIWMHNLPLAVHAIGEVAVETAAKVFYRNAGRNRNSIEHFELVDDDVLDYITKTTIISSQPNFLEWAGKGGMYEDRVGGEWLYKNNPFRWMIDRGIHLAFGSDSMPIGPMYGIYYAVNSEYQRQKITLEEAVRCYSEGGSYLLGTEGYMGMLRVGYSADMAVFDEKLLKDLRGIKAAKPEITIINGKIYTN
ncbi:hypothetical protein [Thermoplasma volcanium GSS1]|uniref:Amidohydrolase 3 domain-containing protein n=1 Tax=Thermoplasma volcanium (strain ATCC 51530 / DSM 4299 / JCM 9571 / NBRC 15438 / GSS1) TaxID=273116 RepID=Q97A71_THEVO|nr:hypothetical protein [Thermoplasma volcanium GSS1]